MAQTVQQLELSALQALTSFPFLQSEVGLESEDFSVPEHQAYATALEGTRHFMADGSASALEVGQRAGWSREEIAQRFKIRYQIVTQAREVVRRLRRTQLSRRFEEEVGGLLKDTRLWRYAEHLNDADGFDGGIIGKLGELARVYGRKLEAGVSTVTNLEDVTLRYIEERKRDLTQGKRRIALPTGIRSLDSAMRGWRPGELTTLVASGGSGKSTLAETWRRALAKQGIVSILFSGEMTEEQQGERTAHAECWTPMNDDLDNIFTLTAAESAIQESGVLRKMLLDTRSRMKPQYLRSVIDSKRAEHGELGLVAIDHLRHLEVSTTDRSDYAMVSAAAEEAKSIAKDCHVPVLLITHTNRKAEEAMTKGGSNSTPDPAMIRGSGRIFEESDNVLCLWRPQAISTLYVWKARQTGAKNRKIMLEYDVKTQEYYEA